MSDRGDSPARGRGQDAPVLVPGRPAWVRSKAATQAIFPCRFAVGAWLALVLGLWVPAQSREALLVTAEEWWKGIGLLLACASWSGFSWYLSRVMLRFRYPGYLAFPEGCPEHRMHARWVAWLPRVLGASGPIAIAGAVLASGPSGGQLWLPAALAALGLGLGVFAWKRRAWLGLDEDRVPEPVVHPGGLVQAWKCLPPPTRLALTLQGSAAALSVVVLLLWKVSVPQGLGSPAILAMSAAGWVCLGTVVTHASNALQLPLLRLSLLAALLFSRCNDNHFVDGRAPRAGAAPAVDTDFAQWHTDEGAPWFFVITEGGGIRAAYWTADVLAMLQDDVPSFNEHLYGISSVSGGSLGAAVYVSLLARGLDEGRYQAGATLVLGVDSLAPILALGLYPDTLQRLLPYPVAALDRGPGLEASWEAAFRDRAPPGDNPFAEEFDALWSTPHAKWIPRLFLNTTRVETGQRAIISYPDVGKGTLSDGIDVERELGAFSLAQSVHMSARFSFVSPAARMRVAGEDWGHLVDGGYFDNSGAATAMDLVRRLERSAPHAPPPIVVVIKFEDGPEGPKPRAPVLRWASDLWAPIDTLLSARVARGDQAVAELQQSVPTVTFTLVGDGGNLPLGWMLSAHTRGLIDQELKRDDNTCARGWVAGVLRGRPVEPSEGCPAVRIPARRSPP